MKLSIFKDTSVMVPRKQLKHLAAIATKHEPLLQGKNIINLILTTDKRMQRLNNEYRSLDKTTDVLSFSFDEKDGSDVAGEIYLSVPVAHKQAKQFGHSLSEEILKLTCHALLHLAGYDHETDREEHIMNAKEAEYLTQAKRTT